MDDNYIAATNDYFHPQFHRLLKALRLLEEMIACWDEDQVASYPESLPSFDEYVAQLRTNLLAIEWKW